ncbi:MAG TPA: MG2 domain-containing protein, partial [Parafilimonas sp.]|nr:MG2 domain-containing protein [Parafilimonas sp.]
MKHSFFSTAASRIAVILPFILFLSCNKKTKLIDVDPAFSQYIDAYTSGVISKKNTIRLVLAADASTTHTLNENVKETLFEFSPAVAGEAYWIDARTIEFKPEKDLTPQQLYEVNFKLGKVLHVPSKFSDFKFNVQVVKPSFEVNEYGLRSNNKEAMSLSGVLLTADVEESTKIEQLLTASLNGTAMKINWQHNESNKEHQFVINNVPRANNAQKLLLQWKGEALNIDENGEKEIQVPAKGDFTLLDVRASEEDEQYALVQFSDPISSAQSLDGLLMISDVDNPAYTIIGSEIKLYASEPLDGNYTVTVQPGVENQWGDKLKKSYTSNVFFENRMPSVKIQGSGNILPNSTGRLVLPFEAINLKSIDVSIIKIYENNIAQFLQMNNMNGGQDLRRVGNPIKEATVRLDDDKTLNLHHKNSFSLDLDKFIRAEPGAIYRVTIGFRPDYSLYSCDSLVNDKEDNDWYYYNTSDENVLDEDEDFWNRYDTYYPYGYNWDERDNPCYSSYYNKEKFATRNILASNIGLTAKFSTNKNLFVAVNDLISTDPMKDVSLEVLDYQQQVIAKGSSDGDGLAMFDLKRKPYLLIAQQGNQFGYLKLDDGSSLPLSRFDVSGDEVKNGIKGYIFGERGVWRPGDSLFLSCIINDKNNPLPKDYPLEMELTSPRGQLYKKIVQTNAEDGFNVFRTATDADVPTGNWTCRVKAGGAVFEKKLKIETVMPNRLKINLDFAGLDALGQNANINGTLTARWLFGATAQNLKAKVDAQLYKKKTKFPKLDRFVFDDPTSDFSSQSKTIFDGTLNDQGTAVVNPNFESGENAPGQLLANIVVKVFEPGGNFSIDNFSMPFNPYSSYAGVAVPPGDKTWGFLQSGKSHKFDIVDVDTKGKYVPGNSTMQVEIYRIQWRWWWDEDDDLSNFTESDYNKFIRKDTVRLTNGQGYYNVKMDEDDWGRYLILVKDLRSGHKTGATFFVDDYSWQARAGTSDPSAAAMLSFTSDKEKYNVGDNINLSIPSSKGGRALISIESGSKVMKTYWVNTVQGQTKFSFKADKEMSPNIYVNVSLIQPHAQTVNDLPIRMYGVIPIMVDDKNTILTPVIKVADVIRPETNNGITVSETNNKHMTYVIALVDDGLLDLTHFKTPNPHDAFYAREALGVKSWDLYDDVIGAFASEIQRILTIGGDAEADVASNTRRANRFKPVVQFMGPFTLNGGSRTHNFTLPPYMGSVRAMVIAAGDDAYGMAEKDVTVKKPLMILPTLPRVVGPGEEVKIPVTIFATENIIRNVSLSIQTNPFISAGGTQTISFSKPGEQQAYFSAKVNNATGIGKVKIVASSGKEQTVYETEIDVRNPNPYTTQVTEATL